MTRSPRGAPARRRRSRARDAVALAPTRLRDAAALAPTIRWIVTADTHPNPHGTDQRNEEAIPALLATGESAMTTTMKTLTTLGFAAAALATTLGPGHAITRLLGHGPVIFHQPSPSLPPKLGIIGGINPVIFHQPSPSLPPKLGIIGGINPVIFHQPSPSLPPKLGIIGGINPVIFHQPSPPPPKISCFACNL